MELNVNDIATSLASEHATTYVMGDKPVRNRALSKIAGMLLTTAFAMTTLPTLADTGHHTKATSQTQVKKHISKKKSFKETRATYFANMRAELNKVKVDQSGVPIQIDEENSTRFTIAKQLFNAAEKAGTKENKIRYTMMGIGTIVEDSHDLLKVNGNPTLGIGFDLVQQKKSFGSEVEMYKTIVKAGYPVDEVMNYAMGKSKTIHTDFKKSLALFSLIQDDYIKIAKAWAGPKLWGLDDATTLITVDIPGFKIGDYSNPDLKDKIGTKYSTAYNMSIEEMAGAAYASYNNGGKVLGSSFAKEYKKGDYLTAINSFSTGYTDLEGVYHENQRLINAVTFLTSGKQGRDYLTAGNFDIYNQTNNLSALKTAVPETYKMRELEKVYKSTNNAIFNFEEQAADGKKHTSKQIARYEQQKKILVKVENQLNNLRGNLGETELVYDNSDVISRLTAKGLYKKAESIPLPTPKVEVVKEDNKVQPKADTEKLKTKQENRTIKTEGKEIKAGAQLESASATVKTVENDSFAARLKRAINLKTEELTESVKSKFGMK